LKALVSETFSEYGSQRSWETGPLVEIFLATLRDAERAVIRDRDYLKLFAYPDRSGLASEIWHYLVETLSFAEGLDSPYLRVILDEGPLARRIVRALGKNPRRDEIAAVYRELCRSLEESKSFVGL
jgi:hypothetical protein